MIVVEHPVAAWQRDLPLRVGQHIDVDESMDNLLRHLKSAYALQEDWHARGQEFQFSCAEGNTDDNAKAAGQDENYVVSSLHLNARDKKILLTLHSLKQIGKEIGLAQDTVVFLLEKRPSLLAETLNCMFNERPSNREWLLRLRLGTVAGNSCWVLRAFLEKGYNRLDSIHLVEALQEFCKDSSLEFSRFAFDGNRLFLHLINPVGSKGFPTEVGDKFCSGITIVNSEIDKRNVIEVDFYFERLICTNGMTAHEKKTLYCIEKSVPLNTQFYNELPEYPLNEKLREQIHIYVVNELKKIFGQLPAAEKFLLKIAQELSSRIFNNESDAIKEILRRMGASNIIEVEDVLEFLKEERRDFSNRRNDYWLIYNAIMRYISHRMLIADPPTMYLWRLGWRYQITAGRKGFHFPKPARAEPSGPPVV